MKACSYASCAVRRHWEGGVDLHTFITSALRTMSGQSHVSSPWSLEIEARLDGCGWEYKWWAVVSAVMNRGVARRAENLLTS